MHRAHRDRYRLDQRGDNGAAHVDREDLRLGNAELLLQTGVVGAFLSLDLPGTKMVIGTGPCEAELKRKFPDAKFLGQIENGTLAAHVAAADVFVFPSRTDTFGVVQLEALASGLPIAAFPVTGPKDVVADQPIGALNEDLRAACLAALACKRDACRAFALNYSWENSARQFIGNVAALRAGPVHRPAPQMQTVQP